ncbi:transposase [Xanthomonas sp.]|uniref:transposase n=1 Tax=Xanthomonas sp. TaxID=29446 RepID=UPI001F12D38E|nr:transposase [Xanthomonas sp.]
MTNHVHLLFTSQQTGAASTLMQSLGRRYDALHQHSIPSHRHLWEGRYKSCPVQDELLVY